MTWPFENDTSAITKKLANRSIKADKRRNIFIIVTIAFAACLMTVLPDLDVTALKPAILLSGYFLFTTPVLFPSVMILTQLISKVIPEGLILLSSILLASVIAGICP